MHCMSIVCCRLASYSMHLRHEQVHKWRRNCLFWTHRDAEWRLLSSSKAAHELVEQAGRALQRLVTPPKETRPCLYAGFSLRSKQRCEMCTSLLSTRVVMKPNSYNKIRWSQPAASSSSSLSIDRLTVAAGLSALNPRVNIHTFPVDPLADWLVAKSVFLLAYQWEVQADHRKPGEGGCLALALLPSKHKAPAHFFFLQD